MGDWNGTVPTILAGYVPSGDDWASVLAELSAISGAFTSWTPTLTNLTLGSGAVTARYRRIGKAADFSFKFFYGTGSAVGSSPSFTLPFTLAPQYVGCLFAYGYLLHTGVTSRIGGLYALSATSVQITVTDGTPIPDKQISATIPFTWGAGDVIYFSVGGLELA